MGQGRGFDGKHWTVLKVLIGGILGMAVAMGIGRFAFTPILPLMQRDLGMSHSVAGWLAGLNYLGYLAGAIVCAITPRILRYPLLGCGVLLLSLATTLGMGLTVSPFGWGLLRLLGGIASAVLFIILTASFSVGQMLGPVIAGVLADRRDGFALPLLLAAAAVTLGSLFIIADRRYPPRPSTAL